MSGSLKMKHSLNLMRMILNLDDIHRKIVLDAVKKLFLLRTQNIHIEFEPFASLYDTLLNAVDRIHSNLSYGDEILENTKALLLLIRHLNWNRLSAKGPFAKCHHQQLSNYDHTYKDRTQNGFFSVCGSDRKP